MRWYVDRHWSNLRQSAVVITVALLLAACGGFSSASRESAPESMKPPAPSPQSNSEPDLSSTPIPAPTPDDDVELSCRTVGVSIAELPARWNEFVTTTGFGYTLPDALTVTGEVFGLSEFTKYLDSSRSALFAISVYWDPDSEQVREVTLFGPVSDEATSIALTGTAGAMVYATTGKGFIEAEDFLVESVMAEVDNLEPGGFISELVEEDGLAFRFTLAGDGADWSVVGSRPC